MIQAKIAAWVAKQTIAFWARLAGVLLILAILLTPTCMYLNVKDDLDDANKTIQEYKTAAEAANKIEKKEIVKVEYKDRVIEKRVVDTKIKREYIYVNNEEARSWGCTVIPDAIIGLPESYSQTDRSGASEARALPDYCRGKDGSQPTSD